MKKIIIVDVTQICIAFFMLCTFALSAQTVTITPDSGQFRIVTRTVNERGDATVTTVVRDSAETRNDIFGQAANLYAQLGELRARIVSLETDANRYAAEYAKTDSINYNAAASRAFAQRIVANYTYRLPNPQAGQPAQLFNLELFVAPSGLLRARQTAQNGVPARNGAVTVLSYNSIRINGIFTSGPTPVIVEFARATPTGQWSGENGAQNIRLTPKR